MSLPRTGNLTSSTHTCTHVCRCSRTPPHTCVNTCTGTRSLSLSASHTLVPWRYTITVRAPRQSRKAELPCHHHPQSRMSQAASFRHLLLTPWRVRTGAWREHAVLRPHQETCGLLPLFCASCPFLPMSTEGAGCIMI